MGNIIGAVKDFFVHWNHPAEGNYVSSKEVVAYSVGGMGVQFLAAISYMIVLSSSCLLLGSVYNIRPTIMATLLLINTIFTILIQPVKSYWIDNVGAKNGKRGKARPFLLWMGIPSALSMSLMAFVPYGEGVPEMLTVAIVGGLFLVMNFFYQFFYGMYIQLAQLMTPNTGERAKIISISSIVYSMAPTITGAIFPLIANAFDKGQTDINFYRILFPVFSILGCVITLLAYFGTKERIVVPKTYKAKVKFIDGMKKIMVNKYFWIINISTWFAFARAALTALLTWAYIYILQNNNIQSVASLVMGTASLIGMASAPFIIKAVGKKWATIGTNLMFVAASVPLIFYNDNFYLFAAMLYVSFAAAAVQLITSPAMNADALDYQQWRTGDRMEGFAGNFAIINSIVLIGTNYIIPYINEYFGLTNNYDVLYDTAVRSPMLSALGVLAVVGALGSALPYIFWDMTEKKQAAMIEDLKERAIETNRAEGFENASILSSDEILKAERPKDAAWSEEHDVHFGDEADGAAADAIGPDDKKD